MDAWHDFEFVLLFRKLTTFFLPASPSLSNFLCYRQSIVVTPFDLSSTFVFMWIFTAARKADRTPQAGGQQDGVRPAGFRPGS